MNLKNIYMLRKVLIFNTTFRNVKKMLLDISTSLIVPLRKSQTKDPSINNWKLNTKT